jgi:hypothetical protein
MYANLKTITRIWLSAALLLCLSTFTQAQIMYAEGSIFSSSERYLLKIDLATCTVCVIKPEIYINNAIHSGYTVLPDGTQLHYGGTNGLFLQAAPPSSDILWSGSAGPLVWGGTLAPDGLVYMTSDNGLFTFDPATYAITYIGPWPAGGSCTGLYYLNGEMHGYWHADTGGNDYDITVNIADPANSTFGTPNPPYLGYPDELTWNGVEGVAFLNSTGAGSINFYNPNTGGVSNICNFSPPLDIQSISPAPAGVPEFPCVDPCITTDAGAFNNIGPYNGCNAIFFPAVTNYDLNPIEGINYILYTDPANPLGTKIATSTGSYFFFNPATMQTGINYYVAAIAGNLSNGLVLLNDPCLDVSDSILVQFKTRPAVTFSAAPTDICPGGCQTINATFTGDAPFTLGGQVVSGTTVVSTFSETFSSNSGTFSVCIPPGVPTGSVQVKATSLADATCLCE